MTKSQPNTLSDSQSSASNSEPPPYRPTNNMSWDNSEKSGMKSSSYEDNGPSSTPNLDRELQKPSAQNLLLALSKAFADAANSGESTKGAAESASKAVTTFIRETKQAKKNGEWSKEDKKAIKRELKEVFKPLKGEMKSAWKGRGPWEQKQEA